MQAENVQIIQNNARQIYDKLLNGQTYSYNELVGVVGKIVQLVPNLNTDYAGNITKYSQKELEQIVKQFIIRIQKKQIEQTDKDDKDKQKIDTKKYDKSVWESKYKEYYNTQQHNIKDLPKILKMTGNHNDINLKIQSAMVALDIWKSFIYNNKKNYFEYIHKTNYKCTAGFKVSLSFFKRLMKIKIGISPPKQTELDFFNITKLPEQHLHPNTTKTPEYKFMVNLFRMIDYEHKNYKTQKYMNKSMKDKNKPSITDVGNEIFKAFEGAAKQKGNNIHLKDKWINKNNELLDNPPLKDVFSNLKRKYNDVKVLDTTNNVKEKLQKRLQLQQSDNFLKDLPYIPDSSQRNKDIYLTSGKYLKPRSLTVKVPEQNEYQK